MLSDGVLYSFEHAIVDEKLRLALRIGIGALGQYSQSLVFLSRPTFSSQCLSLKRRAVVGREARIYGGKNMSGKVFGTCCVASPHGFCVADVSCSLQTSKCTCQRHELRSVDRYTCGTPHFHMHSHCTVQTTRVFGSRRQFCVALPKHSLHPPIMARPLLRATLSTSSQSLSSTPLVLFSSTSPTPGLLLTHPLIHCEDSHGTSADCQPLTQSACSQVPQCTVTSYSQSWLQGGLSLLLPRGSLRGESKRHVMLFVTLLLCQMFMFCSFFGVASRILGSALAPSKDVHRGRVYSHVGGCEVASLDFFVFFVVQCGVSFKHACVCDNTHFTIQS